MNYMLLRAALWRVGKIIGCHPPYLKIAICFGDYISTLPSQFIILARLHAATKG